LLSTAGSDHVKHVEETIEMFKQVVKKTGFLVALASVSAGAFLASYPDTARAEYCYMYCISVCQMEGFCILDDGSMYGPFQGYAPECCGGWG
jgi:hypothetical protein